MMKPKTQKPKPKRTTPTEEFTHMGVIVNLLLQMDDDARFRVVRYLLDRFNVKGAT